MAACGLYFHCIDATGVTGNRRDAVAGSATTAEARQSFYELASSCGGPTVFSATCEHMDKASLQRLISQAMDPKRYNPPAWLVVVALIGNGNDQGQLLLSDGPASLDDVALGDPTGLAGHPMTLLLADFVGSGAWVATAARLRLRCLAVQGSGMATAPGRLTMAFAQRVSGAPMLASTEDVAHWSHYVFPFREVSLRSGQPALALLGMSAPLLTPRVATPGSANHHLQKCSRPCMKYDVLAHPGSASNCKDAGCHCCHMHRLLNHVRAGWLPHADARVDPHVRQDVVALLGQLSAGSKDWLLEIQALAANRAGSENALAVCAVEMYSEAAEAMLDSTNGRMQPMRFDSVADAGSATFATVSRFLDWILHLGRSVVEDHLLQAPGGALPASLIRSITEWTAGLARIPDQVGISVRSFSNGAASAQVHGVCRTREQCNSTLMGASNQFPQALRGSDAKFYQIHRSTADVASGVRVPVIVAESGSGERFLFDGRAWAPAVAPRVAQVLHVAEVAALLPTNKWMSAAGQALRATLRRIHAHWSIAEASRTKQLVSLLDNYVAALEVQRGRGGYVDEAEDDIYEITKVLEDSAKDPNCTAAGQIAERIAIEFSLVLPEVS